MLRTLAGIVVLITGCYFLALAAASILVPARVSQFLHGFASTPARHYLELAMRLIAGSAFVLRASSMSFPVAFTLVGWVLLGTTGVLALVPWTWHRRFAGHAVPIAITHLRLVAVASLVIGTAVIGSLLRGAAA